MIQGTKLIVAGSANDGDNERQHFPWRFNDGENKLKAPNLLATRDLRDTRQIFAQCRKKRKSSWTSTHPQVHRCFVLPVRAENLHDDPDGLFNEIFL